MHNLSIILGLFGDLLTFVGGTFLAWDAVHSETVHRRARTMKLALSDPILQGRLIEIEGVAVDKPEGIEEVFIHFASRNAKVGFALITLGFLLLLAHRVIELCH